ncbi:MAG: S9 family peptidase [Asgard group archaeon]|nr:S9 family peptidase [Asgard group archaeon]
MTNKKTNQKKTPFSENDLYNLKQINRPKIRPGTNEVFYSLVKANKQENDYQESIWRYKKEPRQFTQGLLKDQLFRWSPDGNTLAFISLRTAPTKKNKSKDSDLKPQLYFIHPDGGEARKITSLPTGISSFCWSEDGTKIIFLSRMNEEELSEPPTKKISVKDPDVLALEKAQKDRKEKAKKEPLIIERMIYREGTSFKDDRYRQIHILDIETEEVTRWTENLEDDYPDAVLAPDNSYAISVRQKPGEGDETRNWEFIKILPDGTVDIIVDDHFGWGVSFEVFPNGKYIATTMGKRDLGTLGIPDLCVYDISTGKRTQLAKDIDNQKYLPKWSEDNEHIYFLVPSKGISEIWKVNINTNELEKIVETKNGVISYYDVSEDDSWLTFQAYNVNDPSKLYRYDIKKKEKTVLHEPNKEFLAKKLLGKTEEIWYKGYNDDFKIQGWILTPPNFDPKKKYPLALNMHGGPHVMWSCHQSIPMFHEFQLLTSEGYVVFYCNPRGSAGYGQDFYKAIEKKWGDEDSQDILKGVNLVIEKGYIDEERMGITGGSYAGFLTAWIVGHDNRFTAAVPQRGVYFLTGFWGTSDAKLLIDDEFGVTPLDDSAFLWKRSPAAYAKNITTPLRIIHSELDFRVPIPDAEMLFTAVKRSHPDLDIELVRYPNEGHELSRSGQPKRRLDRLSKIIDWFNKYCQPEKYEKAQEKKKKIEKIKEEKIEEILTKIKEIKE